MDPRNVPFRILAGAVIVAGCCFAASLFLPCIYVQDDPAPFVGWVLFLWGPFGILDGVVAWYANPIFAASAVLLLTRRYRLAALCGIPCLALALSTFAMRQILVSERPDYATITGYGPGFYLWLLSLAILPTSALVLARLGGARKAGAPILAEIANGTVPRRTPGSAGGRA